MYHKKNDKRSIQSSEWIYEALKELMINKINYNYSLINLLNILFDSN